MPAAAKRRGSGGPGFRFSPNGSPVTGTLTVSGPEGGEYTGKLDLTSLRSRNAYAKEAAELLGIDEAGLRKQIIKAATVRANRATVAERGQAGKRGVAPGEPVLTEEARKAGEELAEHPDILAEFRADLARGGFAGETRNAEIVFLALVSRLFEQPVSVAVKGPSSGGKSFLVKQTLEFFPASSHLTTSGLSEHALIYSGESFEHRFLVMAEAAGANKEFADYLIRTLQSEGRIEYETVEKTKEGIRPRRIVKEGPTGFITTTTRVRLNPENETRLLSLTVNDTAAQTKAVMIKLAEKAAGGEEAGKPDLSRWHALQELLACGGRRVVVPYAVALAELVPPKAVRLKRDFGALLSLTQAHALLHRESRERDGEGRVVASLEDYAAVRGLVGEMMSEGVEATASAAVRETVETAARLLEESGDEHITAKAIGAELGVDKAAISRRVRQAVDAGYMENLEDRKGRPMRLVLGEPIPEDSPILPAAEALADGGGGVANESPECEVNRSTDQPPAESGIPKPNSAVDLEKGSKSTAQRPGNPDGSGCVVDLASKNTSTARLPIGRGNPETGCAVDRLTSGFSEQDQPPPTTPAKKPQSDDHARAVYELLEDPPGWLAVQLDKLKRGLKHGERGLLTPTANTIAYHLWKDSNRYRNALPVLEEWTKGESAR